MVLWAISKNSAEMFLFYFHSLGSHSRLGVFRQQNQSAGHLPALAPILSHPRYHDLLSLSAISLRICMHRASF
jgi:hypothetical protein